jgi:hypothetical protein
MVIDDILQARVKPRGVAAPLETTNLCLLLPDASNDLTESMAVGVAIAWRPSTWSGVGRTCWVQERAIFFQFVWSPHSLKPVLGKGQQIKQWNFQISCMDVISTLLDAISCCTIFYRTSQLTSLMILRMTIAFLTLIHHDTPSRRSQRNGGTNPSRWRRVPMGVFLALLMPRHFGFPMWRQGQFLGSSCKNW